MGGRPAFCQRIKQRMDSAKWKPRENRTIREIKDEKVGGSWGVFEMSFREELNVTDWSWV